ncbi:hypothetical protein IWW38_006196 [Coemansia aciculifera]|uniref:Uncharacterized protein n=1 Tax=Coemansia aciculifera TaxID=417176 RepID=A0ACC1LSK7_9FUNG|nr:hypothetical protein IWW38_006196 [Coemansia aciculifera]
MANELLVLILVTVGVTLLAIGILVWARKFRGLRTTQTSRQTRIAQFRPSDRPVKPYNAFSEDELQLIEAIALTDSDIQAINAPKEICDDNNNRVVDHASLRFASPECSICLAPYETADLVRVLVCGHTFHAQCIDVWLTQRSARCPICKEDIRKALGLEPRSDCCRCSTVATDAQSPLSDPEELSDMHTNDGDSLHHHTVIDIAPPPPVLLPQT